MFFAQGQEKRLYLAGIRCCGAPATTHSDIRQVCYVSICAPPLGVSGKKTVWAWFKQQLGILVGGFRDWGVRVEDQTAHPGYAAVGIQGLDRSR